jgi:hypothetical protein
MCLGYDWEGFYLAKRKPGGKKTGYNIRKRLGESYYQGFYDGNAEAHDFWEVALERTKGVGPVMRERIKDEATKLARERLEALEDGKTK